MHSCRLQIAGSSANLGAGFDSLAVALDCWLSVEVQIDERPGIRDAGTPDLLGGENLVIDAMYRAAERYQLRLPGCTVRVHSDIPVARGLGSSAAAIVGGIAAAGVISAAPLSDAQIIALGGSMEGHADNASAAVLGGVTISVKAAAGWIADRVHTTAQLMPVVFVPDSHAFTSEARALLPTSIPMADAVANLGRSALLVHAFHANRIDLLHEAMRDRLHQPHRARIFRHLEPCIAAALAHGAAGASLSGAGPSVLAFAPAQCAADVAQAMEAAAQELEVPGYASCMSIPQRGLLIDF